MLPHVCGPRSSAGALSSIQSSAKATSLADGFRWKVKSVRPPGRLSPPPRSLLTPHRPSCTSSSSSPSYHQLSASIVLLLHLLPLRPPQPFFPFFLLFLSLLPSLLSLSLLSPNILLLPPSSPLFSYALHVSPVIISGFSPECEGHLVKSPPCTSLRHLAIPLTSLQ